MSRPDCGLCTRLGVSCTYPLRQKPRRGSYSSQDASKRKNRRSHTHGTIGGDDSPDYQNGGDGYDRLTAALFRVLDSNAPLEESQEHFTREPTLAYSGSSSFEHANPHQADELATNDVHDSSGSQCGDSSIELPDLTLLSDPDKESYESPPNLQRSTPELEASMEGDSARVNECNGWDMPDEVATEL